MFNKPVFVICFLILVNSQSGWAFPKSLEQEVFRLPVQYQQDVLSALRKSGRNAWELMEAIKQASPQEREGIAFLIANMPGRDLVALKGHFLSENVHLAYQSIGEALWGMTIPKDIFLNNILPYATLNERRDNWRDDFHRRFIKIAQASRNIDDAVGALNKYVFQTLRISYNATRRPKPDQSPYESTQAHYASCTGLSILLVDALRAVGIPARIAAIEMWPDESGNHTWVEVWDGHWHYIGASESTPLDKTWFTDKASLTDAQHPIYATSFKKTHEYFPMRWAPNLTFVPAVNVTGRYNKLLK